MTLGASFFNSCACFREPVAEGAVLPVPEVCVPVATTLPRLRACGVVVWACARLPQKVKAVVAHSTKRAEREEEFICR